MEEIEYLKELYKEKDHRRKWDIKFTNVNREDCEKHFLKLSTKELYNFPEITINDIMVGELEIIECAEPFDSEVIRLNAFVKIKNRELYAKFVVYDDLSPNRWYNLPNEDHLDDTQYTITIRGVVSKTKERLKRIIYDKI